MSVWIGANLTAAHGKRGAKMAKSQPQIRLRARVYYLQPPAPPRSLIRTRGVTARITMNPRLLVFIDCCLTSFSSLMGKQFVREVHK